MDRKAKIMTITEMNRRRAELGYTYEMVAQLSGVPKSTVQKVLGGITVFPHRSTLAALERVLAPSSMHVLVAQEKDSGAKECWVVDPEKKRVLLYTFEDDEMIPRVFKMTEI